MASDSDSDSETPFAARQISSNAQTDDARNEPSRSLLTEVLKKLPHHNLEDRIVCSSTPAPSFGGYSDIYYGFFKADILRDSLTSPHCLICRVKVALRTQACHRCRVIWDENSKLAVKKIRVHVRDRNHVKVRNRAIHRCLINETTIGHSQGTLHLLQTLAPKCHPLHWVFARERFPDNRHSLGKKRVIAQSHPNRTDELFERKYSSHGG